MIAAPFFTVFLADDGRWRIRYRKDLARIIGRGSTFLSFADKKTAERIAGIVARDARLNEHHVKAERSVTITDEALPLFRE